MKILIVDDHQLFADALTVTLQSFYADALITTCDNPRRLLDNRLLLSGYDLVILDQAMPELDGLTLWSAVGRLMGALVCCCAPALPMRPQ